MNEPVPSVVVEFLAEKLKLAAVKEQAVRTRIASLEGELSAARVELAEYEGVRRYIERFNAANPES